MTRRRTLVVERELRHPPEKVWRALTEPSLLARWLMENDFAPHPGHQFSFRAEPNPHWNGVTDCEVLEIQPVERLSYAWNASGEEAETGIRTVVTWTLTPTGDGGVHLRLEHSGFRPDEGANYRGAAYGWDRMLDDLAGVVAGLADGSNE